MSGKPNDEEVIVCIEEALRVLRVNKPDDRSEQDRRYAVTLTELEKVFSYFQTYVINEQP